jgi:hypothetical protein
MDITDDDGVIANVVRGPLCARSRFAGIEPDAVQGAGSGRQLALGASRAWHLSSTRTRTRRVIERSEGIKNCVRDAPSLRVAQHRCRCRLQPPRDQNFSRSPTWN